MIVLDERLSAIAELVEPGSAVCDIGTDHAFLPIALVQSGKAKQVIACDIKAGPLSTAKNNVEKEGAAGKIELRLCSGLEGVRPDEADVIVIAGMGGETIAEIIEDAKWLTAGGHTLLLQPMTCTDRLRSFLDQNGFTIYTEKAVYALGRLYVIIKAGYTGASASDDPLFSTVGRLLQDPNYPALDYLTRKLKSLKECSDSLKAVERKRSEYEKISNLAELLEEKLRSLPQYKNDFLNMKRGDTNAD